MVIPEPKFPSTAGYLLLRSPLETFQDNERHQSFGPYFLKTMLNRERTAISFEP